MSFKILRDKKEILENKKNCMSAWLTQNCIVQTSRGTLLFVVLLFILCIIGFIGGTLRVLSSPIYLKHFIQRPTSISSQFREPFEDFGVENIEDFLLSTEIYELYRGCASSYISESLRGVPFSYQEQDVRSNIRKIFIAHTSSYSKTFTDQDIETIVDITIRTVGFQQIFDNTYSLFDEGIAHEQISFIRKILNPVYKGECWFCYFLTCFIVICCLIYISWYDEFLPRCLLCFTGYPLIIALGVCAGAGCSYLISDNFSSLFIGIGTTLVIAFENIIFFIIYKVSGYISKKKRRESL